MELERIDLYKYFGIKRPAGGEGYLNAYVHFQSEKYRSTRRRPAILVIPGGGYKDVSDGEKEPIALAYFTNGYNSFTLDYSVEPNHYPDQLLEGCMAMAYIRENAEKYKIDKDHVACIGFSAGGHLCGMLATNTCFDDMQKYLGAKISLCRPDAVVLAYAVLSSDPKIYHERSIKNVTGGDESLRKKLSIDKNVDKNSAPAFIWTTFYDMSVPSENSILTAQAYKNAGLQVELHIFRNGGHGLSLSTPETGLSDSPTNKPVSRWLKMSVDFLSELGFNIQD